MKIKWASRDWGYEAVNLPTWRFANTSVRFLMWIERRPTY